MSSRDGRHSALRTASPPHDPSVEPGDDVAAVTGAPVVANADLMEHLFTDASSAAPPTGRRSARQAEGRPGSGPGSQRAGGPAFGPGGGRSRGRRIARVVIPLVSLLVIESGERLNYELEAVLADPLKP